MENQSTSQQQSSSGKPLDVIESCMGTFGRWHVFLTFLIFLAKPPIAMHQLCIVTQAPPVGNFSCADSTLDKCDPNCKEHVFDRSLFTETIITQWDLVCYREFLASLTQTIAMLGILFGNMLLGTASDKWGRRDPLVFAVIMQLVCGCITAFIPNFWVHLVFRFLTTLATGGTMVTSFVLMMELIGIKWRTTIGTLYQLPFNLGHILLAPIAYFLRDWRYQQLAISLPSILLLSYWCIMPESPRWLLAVDKTDKAIKVIETVAKRNKLPVEHIRADMLAYVHKREGHAVKPAGNFQDLFRTPNIRRNWFCMSYNWMVCGLCFYGIAQYMGRIGGNIFLNLTFSATVTVPGTLYAAWSISFFGRKVTLISANLITGLSFLVIAFVPEDPTWPRTALGTIGIFGMMVAFPTVYIYAGEIFPTIIRNIGVGSCSMCARIGSMIAPFIIGVGNLVPLAPPLVFFVIPAIGACLCLLMPETKDCELPDTVEEAEAMGK